MAYAIIKNNKVYRISFSKSLLKHLIVRLNDQYKLCKINFIIGSQISKNEKSKNGLYAIIKKKNNWTLRITLFQEIAELFRDESRYIAECFIVKCEELT